ncbi:hypothetical protein, partial [Pseudoalteromonas sp. SYSU M81241]
DVIGLDNEDQPGEPQLVQMMANGEIIVDIPTVHESRERAIAQQAWLAEHSHDGIGRDWRVERSAALEALRTQVLDDVADGRRD